MDFGSIESSIRSLWRFAWPPVLFLTCVIVIVNKWFPKFALAADAKFDKHFGKDHKQNRMRRFLHAIGASKYYPAALAILGILTFHAVNEFRLICQFIPPTFAYRPEVVGAKLLRDGDLFLLAKQYPEALNFNDAYNRALIELDPGRIKNRRSDFYSDLQLTSKAVFVVAVMLMIHGLFFYDEKWRSIRGCVVVCALCWIVWFLCLFPILREIETQSYSDALAIASKLRERAHEDKIEMPSDLNSQIPESYRTVRIEERWWWVSLTPADSLRWLTNMFKAYSPN